MAFGAGSRVNVQYVREDTFGTTPATPSMIAVPHTGTNLNLTKSELQSAELRSDRQITTARHGNRGVSGDLNFELRVGAYDDFLAAALAGTWATNATTGVQTLVAGVGTPTYTIEVGHEDINQFRVYRGCAVNTLSLNIAPDAMVTGTFGFVGQDMVISGTTLGAGAEPTMTDVVDSFTGTMTEGLADTPVAIATSLEISLDNGIVPNPVIGSAVTPQLTWGRSTVTGTMSVYVQDITLFNKFIQEVESAISVNLAVGGSSYTVRLPRVKYTGGNIDVTDESSIVMQMPFRALYDATAGTNILITKTVA